MQGGIPIHSFIGILVGHTYFFFERVLPAQDGNGTGTRWTQTPAWFRGLFPNETWSPPGKMIPPLEANVHECFCSAAGSEMTGEKNQAQGGSSSGASRWAGSGRRLGTEND